MSTGKVLEFARWRESSAALRSHRFFGRLMSSNRTCGHGASGSFSALAMRSMARSPSGAMETSSGRFSILMASRTSSASGRLSSASRRLNRGGMDSWGMFGDGEEEGGSLAGRGFDPDSSAVTFNHALANCQSDAGAAVFLVAMKSFEYTEDFLLVLRIDADAVVPARKTARRRPDRPLRYGFGAGPPGDT